MPVYLYIMYNIIEMNIIIIKKNSLLAKTRTTIAVISVAVPSGNVNGRRLYIPNPGSYY